MRIKISYEGMPFEHVSTNLKTMKNLYKDFNILTQPNIFYIESENIDIEDIKRRCNFLFNAKFEYYENIDGLTYEECRNRILTLLSPFELINEREVLHKNACLFLNPKILVFDIDMRNLPIDIVTSVMNDQLIFITKDNKCIMVCEESCNLNVNCVKLILDGRLLDRVIAMERDLQYFDTEDFIDSIIMSLCKEMNADHFLCENVYYDMRSRTVSEDLSLLGTISAIKFKDNRLRQIHQNGIFSKEIMIVKCIIHLCNLLKYDLPVANLDPFGVKKSADFIVNYALENGLQLPKLPEDRENFLNKRLQNKIKGTHLIYCQKINWNEIYKHKDIVLNIDGIKRLMKLVEKSSKIISEHIEYEEDESIVSQNIDLLNINYGNLNDYVRKYIDYIDNNRVNESKCRVKFIMNFIKRINEIVSIKQ